MQSMSLHAVMSDSSVHLQLCLDIKDFQLKNIGLISYLPLTYKPAMFVPAESPWNGNEDEVVWRLVPIPGPETPA